jgi:uncharacterized protein YecT (DUF1311 family)
MPALRGHHGADLLRPARSFLVALACLATPPAAAEQISCSNDMSVAGSHACSLAVRAAVEADVHALYEEALVKLREEDASYGTNLEAGLRDAHRAWLRYRDLTCAAEAEFLEDRREWRPAEKVSCEQMMAVMRRDELEYLLQE